MSGKEILDFLRKDAYCGILNKNKTSVTLANDTAKDEDLTVPAGKVWTVLRGRTHNGDSVERNASVICYDSADVEMATLHTSAALATTANIQFPLNSQNAAEDPLRSPLVLEAGDYVRFHWDAGGASAGGTSVIVLAVLERNSD